MNLETILAEWEQDCKIDQFKLDDASRQTPALHSKYIGYLTRCKLMLRKAELDQKRTLKDKWLYYNGKMSKQDIEDRGWAYDPLDGLKVLKTDMDHFYNTDADIIKSEEKITYYKTMKETLTEIVDNLKWRHQTIRNIISWKQFEAGG